VPLERTRSIERYLRDHDKEHRESSWVLNVRALAADRERIELFLLGGGYSGGVYEATASTIIPLYRNVTGPGFAFIFGSLALLMNSVAWAIVGGGVWWFKRRRQAAQQPAAPDGGRQVLG